MFKLPSSFSFIGINLPIRILNSRKISFSSFPRMLHNVILSSLVHISSEVSERPTRGKQALESRQLWWDFPSFLLSLSLSLYVCVRYCGHDNGTGGGFKTLRPTEVRSHECSGEQRRLQSKLERKLVLFLSLTRIRVHTLNGE